MRGKVVWSLTFQHFIGITPAYAGKSLLLLFDNCVIKDHPRVCGEKGKTV